MILLGLPCPRTSLTRLQAPQSTGIELARLLRLVPSILRELDEGVGRHECATRRNTLQGRHCLRRLEAGGNIAPSAMPECRDDVVEIIAIGQQDQRHAAQMAPAQVDPT
jgi:hypothetical protein